VRGAGETGRAEQLEQQPPVVLHDEPGEGIIDELARDALAQCVSDRRLAGLGVGAQPLPGVLLGQRQEPAGERVLVQIAPDRHDTLVLGVIEHAVQLVHRREQRGLAAGVLLIAGEGHTRHTDHRDPSAELHVG
jgi:hypothetical protein